MDAIESLQQYLPLNDRSIQEIQNPSQEYDSRFNYRWAQNPSQEYDARFNDFWVKNISQEYGARFNDLWVENPSQEQEDKQQTIDWYLSPRQKFCDLVMNSQANYRDDHSEQQESDRAPKNKKTKKIEKTKAQKCKRVKKQKGPQQKRQKKRGNQIRYIFKNILKPILCQQSEQIKDYSRRGGDANKGLMLLKYVVFLIKKKDLNQKQKICKQIANNLNDEIKKLRQETMTNITKKYIKQLELLRRALQCLNFNPQANAYQSYLIFYNQQRKKQYTHIYFLKAWNSCRNEIERLTSPG